MEIKSFPALRLVTAEEERVTQVFLTPVSGSVATATEEADPIAAGP